MFYLEDTGGRIGRCQVYVQRLVMIGDVQAARDLQLTILTIHKKVRSIPRVGTYICNAVGFFLSFSVHILCIPMLSKDFTDTIICHYQCI